MDDISSCSANGVILDDQYICIKQYEVAISSVQVQGVSEKKYGVADYLYFTNSNTQ